MSKNGHAAAAIASPTRFLKEAEQTARQERAI